MIATIDFETTGLKAGEDEVLQVSIIDENYNVLLNVYCRPNNKDSWEDAQAVHGIISGDKQEEYREIKPYYTTRFKKIFEMYPNSNIPTGLDKQLIGFRNGYGSSRPQFTAVCSLDIKTGKEE